MMFLHEAISKMQADGLVITNPITDGKLHRCPVENKPNRKDGAYIIYNDIPQTAWWQNWVTGIVNTYTDIPQRLMTAQEKREYKKRIESNKKSIQKEQENKYKEAAEEAQTLLNNSHTATNNHPYIKHKQIEVFGNLRIEDKTGNLLIPVINEQGEIQSLQKIFPSKPNKRPNKLFLTGGKTARGFYIIPAKENSQNNIVQIGEGYATCASAHMATGYETFIAFSADNLLAVAKIVRNKYPNYKIVILADYDVSQSEQEKKYFPELGGKGVAKAKEAACEIGAYLSIPPSSHNEKLDFNDLHCSKGLVYIKNLINDCLTGSPQTKKPIIIYEQGELPRLVRELEKNIAGFAWQMDKLLVHITRLSANRSYNGLRQPAGLSIISAFDKNTLSLLANEKASWIKQKFNKKGELEKEQKINPPLDVISCFLAAYGNWNLPQLTGLVTCPIMRFDGSILFKAGYDNITGLYGDFDPANFPIIEDNPTKDTAIEALNFLKDTISEFPFKTDIDQTVALAGILTAVMRPSVAHAPLFAFSAPTPGTGKSTLADLIGIIATGKPCSAMDYNQDEAEFKKAIVATLIEGPPVVLIDNCVGEVNSSLLNMAITQGTIKGRILGLSENANITAINLWLITGKNLTIVADLTRRTLFCTLDAEIETPARRQFKRDIYKWAEDHRGEIVGAALTILRAFHCTKIQQNMEPMNGFNNWSKLIRGALLWLGEADPLNSQLEIEAHDPEREGLKAVFNAWFEHFGNQFVTTKDLLNRNPPEGELEIPDSQQELYQTLLDVIPGKELTGRLLGNWLAKYDGRVIDGLKLINSGQTVKRFTYWRMIKIKKGE